MKLRTSLLAAGAVGALLLTGCSSVEDQSGSSSSGSSAQPTNPQAQTANEAVTQASQAVNGFTAPGDAISGVDKLQGKSVYFIPANAQIPLFQAVEGSLKEAFGGAGINVEVCDGKANPANMASCIQQAIDAKAGAILTGSIPTELATNAFQNAEKSGIPVVNMMTVPAGPGDPTKVAYITPDYIGLQALAANWVIADSDAQANVLAIEITDTPATTIWAEKGMLGTYKSNCPDCKVTVVKANTGQLDKLASLVTSELSKNPDINYVQTEFDFAVQPVVEGLQAANKTDVKISSQDATLAAMQMLEQGKFVASESGNNVNALGWYGADQALRLMTGNKANQNVKFPYVRAFNSSNIGELDLTPDGEKSGDWYGSTDYKAGFTQLWGLN